jgi:uncharacterized protein (TIGR03067 family)
MKLRLLAVTAAALLLAPAGAQEGDVKKELEKLAGTWKIAKFESADKPPPPEEVREKMRLVFAGEKITVMVDGKQVDETTFKIDPSKSPRHIDIVSSGKGPNKGKSAAGIYTLEGNTLKICSGEPGSKRPTEFSSEKGSKTGILTLERVKE